MKPQTLIGLLLMVVIATFLISCGNPVFKPMDIAAYNQNTKQWKFDYNLFPLNPNWQYKLVNGKAPWTKDQCPLNYNPDDWKKRKSCTSQAIYTNGYNETGCYNGQGHMNWFPVTEVGIVNFIDHSLDDDYNFYLQSSDSSLYLGSDDPDHANQNLALEFDSEEFPDPVDNDYDIWWNHFHDAVDYGDRIFGTDNYSKAQSLVKDKLAIVTGIAGIDVGHPHSNTWTTELHPVFGMFILTDEQRSTNSDGSLVMNDTWSFFIKNWGNEGACGTNIEYAGRKQLNVLIPEMPYYYASAISPYHADARDNVTIDDGNVHITNWNGITDDNDIRRERWTKQIVNGGVILNFNFDSDNSDGIFVGDIKMRWNIHSGSNGFDGPQRVSTFMDKPKFKDKFKWLYINKGNIEREYDTKEDSLLFIRLSKLNSQEQMELHQAINGKIVIPGMPKLASIQKEKSTKIGASFAGKDSINLQQFNTQVRKMKIGDMSNKYSKVAPAANPNQNQYVQRKSSKREFIDAYLKNKHL